MPPLPPDARPAALTVLAASDTPWTDIPGVRILGAILGTLLLIAAVRSMFGGKGR